MNLGLAHVRCPDEDLLKIEVSPQARDRLIEKIEDLKKHVQGE